MKKTKQKDKTTRNIIISLVALTIFLLIYENGTEKSGFKLFKNDKAIEIVKQSDANGENNTWEEFLTKAAGLDGKIDWSSFTIDNNNPRVTIVEANIIKNHKGVIDTLKIQWKVNVETKFSKSAYFGINGKSQSLIAGMMILESWIMEN